jgi:hypothetical protein
LPLTGANSHGSECGVAIRVEVFLPVQWRVGFTGQERFGGMWTPDLRTNVLGLFRSTAPECRLSQLALSDRYAPITSISAIAVRGFIDFVTPKDPALSGRVPRAEREVA